VFRAGTAALVAVVAITVAPIGGARQQARGCCYDAAVTGDWNRLTNTATVSWTIPYPDLVTDAVQVGTTIASTGFLADDGGRIAQPPTNGPVRIGTPAFPIDAYVYVQVWFKCVPHDAAHPACGPIAAPVGTPLASLPAVVSEPLEAPASDADFTLSGSSDDQNLEVRAGGTGTAAIWVIPENGFYESVDFSASPPPGLAVSFAPASSRTGTTATVSAAAGTPSGNYSLTVAGTTGPRVQTLPLAVTVLPAQPVVTTPTVTTPPKPKAKPKAKPKPKKKKPKH
jgi:hypothetical protein